MKQTLSVLIMIISILFHSQLVHLQIVPLRFRIITWNVGNSEPNCTTFKYLAFASVPDDIKADLIVFGFQEASKKLIGSNSFHKTLKQCLQDNSYIEMLSDYVGSSIIKPIWLYIYVLNTTMQSQRVNLLKYKKEPTLKVYQDKILESVVGYKGVLASRIEVDKSINMMFVNMHLPAGEGKTEERCKLWSKFLQTYEANNLEDDYMFAFGDQNWRTLNTLNIDKILKAIEKKEYQTILHNDELTQMHNNDKKDTTTECLSNFFEAPITFPPTYKYMLNSDEYQTQKNNEDRRPSYTDRILVSPISRDLEIVQYSSMNDIKLSDHRPVFADLILYQQFKNHKTSLSKNKNKNLSMKIDIKQSLKENSMIFIPFIILIAIICLLGVLAIYYFLIKQQRKEVDIPQTTSTDLVHTRSNSELTL